jgi:hypothetical protein
MAVQTRIQIRRGTLAQWNAAAATLGNGILYQGEVGYETDTGRFKIGDGSTAWGSLNYASVLPSNFVAGSGISLSQGSNGSTLTISLSNPNIQVSNITDFAEGVDDRVASLLTSGSGIGLSYNDGANTLAVGITGIPSSLITNFADSVNSLIDGAVSTSIVAGSGVDIVYNSGNNTLSISSALSAGSGISVSHSSGNYTISLSDPTIQLVDITDMSTNARNFISTPSSSNLAALVTDETGSGSIVFANNPTMSGVTINGNLTVGGSGLVASNINNFDSQVRTSRLDQMASPTADVTFNSRKITNLADPTNDQDAATKAYVDAARSGLDVKQSVRVATTASIALIESGTASSSQPIIDGVTLQAGDRVLVKDQATPSKNGIYIVTNVSTLWGYSRATDADTSAEVTAGMFTFVSEGTVNADSGWVLTTNDTITLGTTALSFAQFSGAGQITAGAGLTKSGNTLDIGTASSSRIVVNADNIDLATVTRNDSNYTTVPVTTFLAAITTDSYGRVTATTTAPLPDATTTAKGIASFDTNDFSVTSGAVSIKTSGVGNSQLENSSVTVGSTNIALGGTSTTLAGLSSVTSTSFVGALTGNASTATALQNARTINGASFDGTQNITIQFVDGGTP